MVTQISNIAMKEYVKLKVTDVLMLLSSLERDINELNNTVQSISENRDYSYTLKKSISDEIMKLKSMKDSILESEVDIPKQIYVRSQSNSLNVEIEKESEVNGVSIENNKTNLLENFPIKKEKKVHRY
ncbi:MAG TPA: hypothetical protein PKL30_23315 [Leptospiraceae bacterium]|nr:hypothetical protein [Leptospiraceae bacterium]HNC58314.1 hypothetical protein [Leptospiraceae bacterium]HNF53024.1 hypothetical protein [Leptospiraceae bacterium]HNL74807.1 hypothetical protein [Leptospiraceae bacterium]HNN81833.1 hypothetical protein [Leptospiraceae bacterium]